MKKHKVSNKVLLEDAAVKVKVKCKEVVLKV